MHNHTDMTEALAMHILKLCSLFLATSNMADIDNAILDTMLTTVLWAHLQTRYWHFRVYEVSIE